MRRAAATRRGLDARGFSLPEVTLALGLLGGVLISLSGLFVMSERLVHGGKSHTEALAIARNVLEETNGWTFEGLYGTFGLDGASVSHVIDSRANAYAARWQSVVEEVLGDGYVEVSVRAVADIAPTPILAQARGIRVSVTVHWRDELRPRQVRVATVRT